MKPKSIHRLILSLCAAASLAWLPACSDDKAQEIPFDDSPTFLSFNLVLDKSDLTRGDDDSWGNFNPQEAGYAFDQRIDQFTFRPVLFKVNNDGSLTHFADITPLTLLDPGQSPNNTQSFALTCMFAADKDKGTDYESLVKSNDKFRLMIFTNDTEYLSFAEFPQTLDGSKATFTQIGNEGKPGFNAVPMWGVSEFNFKNLNKGEALQIGDIPLLRSMAMVRVKLAPLPADAEYGESVYDENIGAKRKDVKLLGLTISRYNAKGYVAPQEWATTAKTNDDTHKTYRTINAHDASLVNDSYSIRVGDEYVDGNDNPTPSITNEENGETYHFSPNVNYENIVFYLPEIENDNNDPLILTIHYCTSAGDERINKFPFRTLSATGTPAANQPPITPGQTKYEDGTSVPRNAYWHVVRNHIYEYVITGVQDSKISIEANVKDWQYHKTIQPLE